MPPSIFAPKKFHTSINFMDQLHYTIQNNDAWTNILLVNELLELGLV